MRRGQSTVGVMLGVSAVILAVALVGYLWPEGIEALVVRIGNQVATLVEIP